MHTIQRIRRYRKRTACTDETSALKSLSCKLTNWASSFWFSAWLIDSMFLAKVLAGAISGAFDGDNDTIRRTAEITAPVLPGLVANEVAQLFTMGPDPGRFAALTSIGRMIDGEVDFTS